MVGATDDTGDCGNCSCGDCGENGECGWDPVENERRDALNGSGMRTTAVGAPRGRFSAGGRVGCNMSCRTVGSGGGKGGGGRLVCGYAAVLPGL